MSFNRTGKVTSAIGGSAEDIHDAPVELGSSTGDIPVREV
jgi:hypothetical protein